MITKELVKRFFKDSDKIAFAGVSRKDKSFSRYVYNELTKKNYNFIPVNPNLDEIDGKKCYARLGDIEEKVNSAIIMTPTDKSLDVLKDAIDAGIENIWVQQKSESPELKAYIQENDIECITGECIMMYAHPVSSFHKIHEIVWKIAGKYAK